VTENELSNITIGRALKVHSALGPGLLESAYEACLQYELLKLGLFAETQKKLPLVYESVKLECGYRIDLWVERRLIVDVKSVEAIHPVHVAQVLTYLRLTDCKLGLLINFKVMHLRDGIRRVVNNL
jgi:GxxExxY protein